MVYTIERQSRDAERMRQMTETKRLYYEDVYKKEFTAKVLECREAKKGFHIILDESAFYPEGGGQPSDTGALNGVKVLHVSEKGEEIIHELEAPLEEGVLAEGVIDWKKRYDNMQQHTGEHIFSGLVHKHFGYDNVGFHMGTDEVTVDFNGVLTQEQLDELEDEANQLIYDNVPVKVFYPSKEELEELDYRSKKELTGLVRIVEIPGGDICACCGIHVETTGEVGLIKLRTMINYKGGVRISMLCGRRALMDYRERLKDEIRISNLLSAKLALVPDAVEKMKNESQEKDLALGRLWQQLLEKKTESYPESTEVLAVFEEGLLPVQLRQLATMLYEKGKGKIVGVFSGNEDEQVYQYALGSSQADMRKLSKAMNGALNGRGGGSNLMAQGTFKAAESAIRETLMQEAGNLE